MLLQRWALWVFELILRAVVPEGMIEEVLSGLPEELVMELEGYVAGLKGDSSRHTHIYL